jgi:hypothetical protein
MERKQFYLTVIVLTAILGLNETLLLGQIKEWENNVIYSEKKVPFYELPDPLLTVEGKRIRTQEEWINIRRPQIMGMFASTIYGRVPEPEFEIRQEFEVLNIDKEFLDGRCTRKQLLATFSNERGKVQMHIAVFTPNDVNGPVPALLNMGARARGTSIDLRNIQSYGELGNGTPLIHFLDEGLGVVCVEGGEIIRDENGFNETIHELFYKGNQSIPRADEWGVLAGIAWQASRAMDYMETDTDIDPEKIAIVGFSKIGKCVLWAGAQDIRFSMVFLQNSGCGGAALWRRTFGETLAHMCMSFPHWLCGNAQKYIGRENDLPVDQHMLMACIAPRVLYVTSGIDDMWADNLGEYLSTHHATPVYELFGKKGQATLERPRINKPAEDRALSYCLRSGAHGFEQADWDRYIRAMVYHFNKK